MAGITPRPRRSKPSAPLAMGVFSGMLAAIVVLPTAIPLYYQLEAAENGLHLRHVERAVSVAASLYQADDLSPSTTSRLGVDVVSVHSPEGRLILQDGPDFPESVRKETCLTHTRSRLYTLPNEQRWATACMSDNGAAVFVAWAPDPPSAWRRMFYLVFLLALIVGIVTALGVLRVLSPLSRVKGALELVGAGERGVIVAETGFAELDELIDRVNVAARAMEDREEAIHARIQVVQEMARLVAHEVRNPLQSLELLTTLIASEEESSERHELADAIHTEIRALDNVVSRMLREGSSTGALRLHLQRRSLRPLIEQVMTLCRPQATNRGIRVRAKDLHDAPVPVDAALIGRSIENLVVNALQVVHDEVGVIEVGMIEEPDYIGFVVDDNGPGINPEIAASIFEPHVSGREGTGLGLTLVKGVVEAHGGYIEAGVSPLGGARFVVRIAKHPESVEQEP
jgi:signal transduction histidine kinase